MEIPNSMISDAIKKSAEYNYYMAKKKESANNKIVDEPNEQRASAVKCGIGKGFICYGNQVVNVPKKDVVPRKTRSLTIVEEIVVGEHANSISIQEPHTRQRRRSQLTIDSQIHDAVLDTYAKWGQKLKGSVVEDLAVQSLLDLQKGSKSSRLENTDSDAILYSSCSEESEDETNDAEDFDMDLSNDSPQGDDDDAIGFGVFMYNKSTETPTLHISVLWLKFPHWISF
ncbi:hypothetical protein Tco_1575278 [Tanacetum coccineum]